MSVLLRATPDEFASFWKNIVSQASPEQLSAALRDEEVQRAIAASSPFFDSLLDRQAIGLAAVETEVLQSLKASTRTTLMLLHHAAMGTSKRAAMNKACPRMSSFGNHLTWPFRIMCMVSVP